MHYQHHSARRILSHHQRHPERRIQLTTSSNFSGLPAAAAGHRNKSGPCLCAFYLKKMVLFAVPRRLLWLLGWISVVNVLVNVLEQAWEVFCLSEINALVDQFSPCFLHFWLCDLGVPKDARFSRMFSDW